MRRGGELLLALGLMALLGLAYALVARQGVPRASGPLGHGLGIVGFALMLATETLYSLRKRWKGFHYGPMTAWLQAHIVMGLVGPFLVLLHTGWKFHGVAGWATLLLGVVVVSGFVGRYIYTAIPRSLDGVELAAADLESRLRAVDGRLRELGLGRLAPEALARAAALPPSGWWLVLSRPFQLWHLRRRLGGLLRGLRGEERRQARELIELVVARQRLRIQIESLVAARRLLALWHVCHIPLGGVLFALAFVHIAGALYYATFLRW